MSSEEDAKKTEVFLFNAWIECTFEIAPEGSIVLIFVEGNKTTTMLCENCLVHPITANAHAENFRPHLDKCEPRLTRIIEYDNPGKRQFIPIRLAGNQDLRKLLDRNRTFFSLMIDDVIVQ